MFKLFRSNIPFSVEKLPFFYGYVIICGAIVTACITSPGQTIGVSVYTDYFIKTFHLSRLEISAAYMVGTVMSSLMITRVGAYIDRYGSRIVTCISTIMLGLTLLYFTWIDQLANVIHDYVTSLSLIVLEFILISLGFFALRFFAQGVLGLISRTLTLKWFVQFRGRVASLVGIFLTLSMSISPLIFNHMIKQQGWRGSYYTLAMIVGIACSLGLWAFLRDTPEQCGQLPDGKRGQNTQANPQAQQEVNWRLRQAKQTYTFWVFNISLALFSFLSTAFTFHVTSIFTLHGLSRSQAIDIFFPAACISVMVKIISGWLCDMPSWHDKLKYQLSCYCGAMIIFCLGILFVGNSWAYYAIVLGMGMSTGLFITISSVCWAQFFGRKHVGEITGFNTACFIFSSALGPVFFALSVKLTGFYAPAVLLSLLVIVAFLLFSMRADAPVLKQDTH